MSEEIHNVNFYILIAVQILTMHRTPLSSRVVL